jgi:hypothetical protein
MVLRLSLNGLARALGERNSLIAAGRRPRGCRCQREWACKRNCTYKSSEPMHHRIVRGVGGAGAPRFPSYSITIRASEVQNSPTGWSAYFLRARSPVQLACSVAIYAVAQIPQQFQFVC